MPKTFYRQDSEIDAIRKIANGESKEMIKEGFVLTVSSGTANVQLVGSSNVIEVEIMRGLEPSTGDHVFMVRSMIVNRWFIFSVGVVQAIKGNISSGSISAALPVLTAPNSHFVVPGYKMLVYGWSPSGVRPDLVYQVGVANDGAGTGEVQYLVAGGAFPLAVAPLTTKYFRIRSVDKSWNTSGWTAYVSGTSLDEVSGSTPRQLLEIGW